MGQAEAAALSPMCTPESELLSHTMAAECTNEEGARSQTRVPPSSPHHSAERSPLLEAGRVECYHQRDDAGGAWVLLQKAIRWWLRPRLRSTSFREAKWKQVNALGHTFALFSAVFVHTQPTE